jgi:hypothetical protein
VFRNRVTGLRFRYVVHIRIHTFQNEFSKTKFYVFLPIVLLYLKNRPQILHDSFGDRLIEILIVDSYYCIKDEITLLKLKAVFLMNF